MGELAQQVMASGAPLTDDQLAAVAGSLPTLEQLYIGMLQHGADAFAQVARLVAASTDDEPTAVLVHCTAGKDRTGVAVALLLEAAGAERSAVVADYTASQANLAGGWADGMLQTVASLGLPLSAGARDPHDGFARRGDRRVHSRGWMPRTAAPPSTCAPGGLTTEELATLRTRLTA